MVYEFKLVVNADSSAAVGMSSRHGLGRAKNLDIGELWVQEKIKDSNMKLVKVSGCDSLADLVTKRLDRAKVDEFLDRLSMRREKGRHPIAPTR